MNSVALPVPRTTAIVLTHSDYQLVKDYSAVTYLFIIYYLFILLLLLLFSLLFIYLVCLPTSRFSDR
jgi:hypothetical protein